MTQSIRKCSIDECMTHGRLVRGWCPKHYTRWLRWGDPLELKEPRGSINTDPLESLYANSRNQGSCIVWNGSLNQYGYGQIGFDSNVWLTHRLAWTYETGENIQGKILDHTCHNPACFNIEHLRIATYSENGSHRSGPEVNSKSGIRNVYKHRNKWRVRITKNQHVMCFGFYDTIEEAAAVAERERKRLFGEFAGRG